MGDGPARYHILAFYPPFLAGATLFPLIFLDGTAEPFTKGRFWNDGKGFSIPRKNSGFPGLLLIHGGPSRTNKEPFPMMTTGLNRLIEPNMSSSL